MLLKTVRVFSVTAIIRADGWFNIGNIPRFRPKDAQESGRVHGAGTHLGVVRLPYQAALIGPEMLQRQDDGLELCFFLHNRSRVQELSCELKNYTLQWAGIS